MSSIASGTTTTTALVYTADTTGNLVLQTGSTPTTAATFDTNQNMGLGVTPSAWAAGYRALDISSVGAVVSGSGFYNLYNNLYNNGSGLIYKTTGYATFYSQRQDSGQHQWYVAASGTAGASASVTQAMTLDNSSNLFVGTTNTATGGLEFSTNYNNTASSAFIVGHASGSSSGDVYGLFRYGASTIGSITQSGTTAVLYNTTSDQRLKENIVDAPDASADIDSIKVRSFDFISDKSPVKYGFIAQELVTVAPDAVHQPSNPDDMMGVDYSKLVPMMLKEIQSLRARLKAANIA